MMSDGGPCNLDDQQGRNSGSTDSLLRTLTVVCCVPAILSACGMMIPSLLRPAPLWPLVTAWDRGLVAIFRLSAKLALVSPVTTFAALCLGVAYLLRKGGPKKWRLPLAGILALAVVLQLTLMAWVFVKVISAPGSRG
jgi:hypothetical protein